MKIYMAFYTLAIIHIYPLRWEVAKKVAYTVLNRYCRNEEINASVFYKPAYYTSIDFKLRDFSTYYDYCSTTLYLQQKDWIDARTYIE